MLLHALCQHAAKQSMFRSMPTIAIQPGRLLTSCRSVPRISSFRTFAVGPEMPGVELKVMDKLKEKQHAITTVESCTGGRIADLLTNVGGAAQVYWGSVVTYDGSLKSDWGVPACSIKDTGTVTEQARHPPEVPQALCIACGGFRLSVAIVYTKCGGFAGLFVDTHATIHSFLSQHAMLEHPDEFHALIREISRVIVTLLNMQVAGEMAAAGLKRMIDGYNREKECSDLAEPKGFICVSSTGFAGGAPTPDLSGTCYLGIAMSSMDDPVVKKVHANGDSREHRVQHKDYFAEQALQMVMEHL